jgi:lipopolysaccharide biosynthesis glycosyltransferase
MVHASDPVARKVGGAMHIVTGSDDNFVPGVLVLIASAAWHNPNARFTVLDLDMSAASRARIGRLAERLGVRIDRVEVDAARFAGLTLRRRSLTRGAFLRLLIPDLLPDEERVLYMDCDMVVTDDLSPAWSVALGDAPLAAVADPVVPRDELEATATRPGEYVNSGLLLMNLPVWRRERLAEAAFAVLVDPERPPLSADQTAINVVCRGRMIRLPARFNLFSRFSSVRSPEMIPTDPAVIHFVAGAKPWMRSGPCGEVWHLHAERIRDLLPPRPPAPLSRRLSETAQRLRRGLELALGLPRARRRHQKERAIHDRVVRPYLAAQQARLS